MEEVIRIDERVRNILIKHSHKKTATESLTEMLKNEIARKIKKFMIMIRFFENKYKADFTSFEASKKNTDMDYEIEKDYFDWDMAVTAVEDLKEELKLVEA